MPVCKHRVHVKCALSAAQYDLRCPVCRTRDPALESKQERETRIFSQLQEYAVQREATVQRYQRRRAAVVRTHDSLKKLRDRIKNETRQFMKIERELEKAWFKLQRHAWMHDSTIKDIKNQRRKQQRRVSALTRRMNARLVPYIGEMPETL